MLRDCTLEALLEGQDGDVNGIFQLGWVTQVSEQQECMSSTGLRSTGSEINNIPLLKKRFGVDCVLAYC